MNIFGKSKDLVMRVIESTPQAVAHVSTATKGLFYLGLATVGMSLASQAAHADTWDDFQRGRGSPAPTEEVAPAEKEKKRKKESAEPVQTPAEQFNDAVAQGQRYMSHYQFFVGGRFTNQGGNQFFMGARDHDPREDNLTWDLQLARVENVSKTHASKTVGDAQNELSGSLFLRGIDLSKRIQLSPRAAVAIGDHRKMGELGAQFDKVDGVYHPRLGFWKRMETSEQNATVSANGTKTKVATDLDDLSGYGVNAGFDLPTRLAPFAFDAGYFQNEVDGKLSVRGPSSMSSMGSSMSSRPISFDTHAWYARGTANLGQMSVSYLYLDSETNSAQGTDGKRRNDLILAAPKVIRVKEGYHLGGIVRGSIDTDSNRGAELRLILSHPIVAELRARELAAGDTKTTEAIDAHERLEALRQRGIFTFEAIGGLDRNLETDLRGQHYGLELNRRWGTDDGMNRLGLGWQQSVSDFGSGSRSGRDTVYGVFGFANGVDFFVDYARNVVRGEQDGHEIGFKIAIPLSSMGKIFGENGDTKTEKKGNRSRIR